MWTTPIVLSLVVPGSLYNKIIDTGYYICNLVMNMIRIYWLEINMD